MERRALDEATLIEAFAGRMAKRATPFFWVDTKVEVYVLGLHVDAFNVGPISIS